MDKMKEIISLLDAGYSREEINDMLNSPEQKEEAPEVSESAQESEKPEPEESTAPVDNSAEIKALADEVKALKQLIQKQNRKAAAVDSIQPQESASDVLARLINPNYNRDGGKIK